MRRFTSRAATIVLLLAFCAVMLPGASGSVSAAPSLAVADARFGVIEAHNAPERAAELQVGWSRARFHWASVQPDGPDQWVPAELTGAELERELAAGREVLGLLIGLPDWAADEDGLPRGLYEPVDSGENTWANYVREAVTRYAGQIDHWIIWNEPDVWDADHPAFTWAGTEADFVQLMKVAYIVANEANPDAVIHLGAMSHWWDALYDRELYFPRLLDAILDDPDAADYNYFYDVATLHLYFNPADIYTIAQDYAAMQAERGLDKPFWLIETNAAPSSDPAWLVSDPTFRVSLLEQAAYIPQAFALSLAAGIDRVGIYKLIDTPGDYAANPEPFGLVRADDTPRPAFESAKTTIRLFNGAGRVIWNEQHIVSQVIVERPGEVMRVLWNRIPEAQVVTIPALSESAALMDMWGNRATITPEDGVYNLILLAGECQQTTGDYCMIGGPVMFVIEDVADMDAFFEQPLPGVTYEPMPDATTLEGDEAASGGLPRWARVLIAVVLVGAFEFLIRRRLFKGLRTKKKGE